MQYWRKKSNENVGFYYNKLSLCMYLLAALVLGVAGEEMACLQFIGAQYLWI